MTEKYTERQLVGELTSRLEKLGEQLRQRDTMIQSLQEQVLYLTNRIELIHVTLADFFEKISLTGER